MKNKSPKKYNIPQNGKKIKPTHVVYICSIVTMFAAIGTVLLVIPNTAEPTAVPSSETSSLYALLGSKSSSSSSSRPEPKPIPSENSTSETSSEVSSSEQTSSSAGVSASSPAAVNSGSTHSSSTPIIPPQSSSSANNSTIPNVPNPKPISEETIFTNGIAIVGNRAMTLYGANSSAFVTYAEAINKYKEALPGVNCYCMLIPTACEFYGSPEVNAKCASQRAHINIAIENLKNIKYVDAYSALAAHTDEPIYLRTDHHWAALGGYYAAEAFAKAAGVPFLPLSDYTEKVNTGFVGTMYGYSGNNAIIKNNPEDFVYHVPKTVEWTTTYYNYKLSGGKVVSVDTPMKAAFFLNYGDNRSDNYCTFMGGDAKIVHVETSTKNGRRLAIFKESFGNPIPGYLFGSFEEIYVLDQRYFSHNAIEYLKEKNITDVLFANNTVAAGNTSMSAKYDEIRTQKDMGF